MVGLVVSDEQTMSPDARRFFPQAVRDDPERSHVYACERCGLPIATRHVMMESPDFQVFGMGDLPAIEYERLLPTDPRAAMLSGDFERAAESMRADLEKGRGARAAREWLAAYDAWSAAG